MNTKDMSDVGDVVYWLAAVRNDLESLRDGSLLGCTPMDFTLNALRCLSEAEQAIERVALGVNRKRASRARPVDSPRTPHK